ncbi:MAG: hypothetical protein IT426_12955 [Pirellulales bacterium]|nr:hypothetical protein [Pirellulales bacterium]
MICRELFEEIGKMLAGEKYSQRAIARRLGVSRGAVQSVARGKRRSYPPPTRSSGEGFQPPRGLHFRCPGCGGMVQMPCLACYLRKKGG